MKFKSIKKIFEGINTKEKLDIFLKETNDDYCKFILLKKTKPEPIKGRIEVHHIIPLHADGPKFEDWNQIKLSFDDHTYAHSLLASCYTSQNDHYACTWRSGLTEEARRLQREYAKNRSVFVDSKMQSQFGRKGGRVWSKQRLNSSVNRQSLHLTAAFSNGMIWYAKSTNSFIQVNPGQCNLLTELTLYLKNFSYKIFSQKNLKNSLPNALSKVLSGQSIQACNEFYLVGIFTTCFKNKNAKLGSYYKKLLLGSQPFLKYSNSVVNWKKSSSNLTYKKPSMYTDSVVNLQYSTIWYNKKNNITLEVPPVQTVIELISLFENTLNVTYTRNQKKQISALTRGGWIGRTRVGWTLIEIKFNLK